MKILENGIVREMTPEEMAEFQKQAEIAEAQEKNRPFTEAEVFGMLIVQHINSLTVDDSTAMRMKSFYPGWSENTPYTAGFKVQHSGNLWRCLQAHTAQDAWQPGKTTSLWEQMDEIHTGELSDPVPYNGNMALETGKYYIENRTIYRRIRDTVNPVYNPMADLAGMYVELIA